MLSGFNRPVVTIGMNYSVLPGKEEVFERAVGSIVDAMRSNPDHLKSQLYREVGAAGVYLILSEWESEEGFGRFIRSEGFARVTQWGKEQVLSERPRHQVYSRKGT